MSRITGLVRDQLMAASFGASAAADAFHVAFRIPNLFRRLFAEGAFSQAFVPMLARVRETEGDAATRQLVDAVATVLFWVLLLTCAVGVVAAPVLVWLMASGLRAFGTATLLTRWMFPYIGFMSLGALSAGILSTRRPRTSARSSRAWGSGACSCSSCSSRWASSCTSREWSSCSQASSPTGA